MIIFILVIELSDGLSLDQLKWKEANFCSGNFNDQKDLKFNFKPTLFKKERHRLKQCDLGRRIGRIFYSGQVFEGIELDTL